MEIVSPFHPACIHACMHVVEVVVVCTCNESMTGQLHRLQMKLYTYVSNDVSRTNSFTSMPR